MNTEERAALIGLHHCLPLLSSHQAARISAHGPLRTLESLRAGRVPAEVTAIRKASLEAAWVSAARSCDPDASVRAHAEAGVWVAAPDDADWPFAINDPAPPALLFGRGDRSLLGARPSVGVIGTRNCTAIGRQVATQLGACLSAAGIAVVSGLALGIDGSAHRGVVDVGGEGPPIAVVAGGLDVVYPRRHARLHREVIEQGLIVSESALGVGVEPWRFLARNRLIAALSSLLVVVESKAAGGALATVTEANARGVDVGAVPGSVLSPTSAGTNALLAEGALVVRDVDDIFFHLGLRPDRPDRPSRVDAHHPGRLATDLDPLEAAIVAEVRAGTDSLESLASGVGRPMGEVLSAITRLQLAGEVERVGSRVVPPASSNRGDAPSARKAPLR